MRLRFPHFALFGTLVAVSSAFGGAFGAKPKSLTLEKDVRPLLKKFCYDCHGEGEHRADLALDDYKTPADIVHAKAEWELILHHVHSHTMPPAEEPQPSQSQRDLIATWIEQELYHYDPRFPDPGRVTIRRLNRAEYNNTVRDLVGVDFQPADDFPADDSGYGFDNIADVLSLPPMLFEKYLTAADKLLNQAIVTEPVQSRVQRVAANLAQIGFNAAGDRGDGWVQLISLEEDDVALEQSILAAGDYVFRVQAFAQPTGGVLRRAGDSEGARPEPLILGFALDDVFVKRVAVTADEAHPGTYEVRLGVPTGHHRFRVVVPRLHGGDNELVMLNGRIGRQQSGILFVRWLELEGPLRAATIRRDAASLAVTGEGRNSPDGARLLAHNGEVSTELKAARDGEFILRAQAFAQQAGNEPARMEFRVDGKPVKTFDVLAPAAMQPLKGQNVFSTALLVAQPEVYEYRVRLAAGPHHFAAAFVNDFADPKSSNPNLRDRNLIVQNLETAELGATVPLPPLPAPLRRIFSGEPTATTKLAVARTWLGEFARRAWRRPVAADELDRLVALFALADQRGEKFEVALKIALKATLVSPQFLFRGEIQPEPDNPQSVHPVNEFALASRLSYFLWSSMPDEELFDLAARGMLRKNLTAQVRRMLASPKSRALVENFASQWLQFRSVKSLTPDKERFPDFDERLRSAIIKETETFFDHVMRDDLSVLDFLNADYTYVNERLAKHYGIAGVTGEQFRRVSLAGTPRRGVVTQASVLLLTSNPNRTSPVKRGKWVLENLLGTPPPPPPPDVPDLKVADNGQALEGTLRHQMEMHREKPACAACHARMDPIGFGLENFDGIGAWRTKDGALPIEAAGKLNSGEEFKTAIDLTNILAKNKRDDFIRCLSEKMLTYALGRGLEYYDRTATDKISAQLVQSRFKFSSLILAVVDSLPFQNRRGEGDRSVTPAAAPAAAALSVPPGKLSAANP